MSQEEIIEQLLSAIQGAANMMRGMKMDPSIPSSAKDAMDNKIHELDSLVDEHAE